MSESQTIERREVDRSYLDKETKNGGNQDIVELHALGNRKRVKPKVTFSYAADLHTLNQTNPVIYETRQTLLYPREEIIFYPVVHNRFIISSPHTPVTSAKKASNKGTKAVSKFELFEKGKSYKGSKEVMTP